MTIQKMIEIKQKMGMSFRYIAGQTGVPLGTVQKVFNGQTKVPRYETMQALEAFFSEPEMYDRTLRTERVKKPQYGVKEEPAVYESGSLRFPSQGQYTLDDYYHLPDEVRAELIDGCFYLMAAPTRTHQLIAGEIYRQIANFIYENDGPCEPMIAPFDVQLDGDGRTMVEPDVLVVCDREKNREKSLLGAPDYVLEVTSPSTRRKDLVKKLEKYSSAGVREYWILDIQSKRLITYYFEDEGCIPEIYTMEKPVPVQIFDGKLEIQFDRILKWMENEER